PPRARPPAQRDDVQSACGTHSARQSRAYAQRRPDQTATPPTCLPSPGGRCSGSFLGWCSSVRAHSRERAAEPGEAGPRDRLGVGPEVAAADPLDRALNHLPAAGQLFGAQRPLRVLADARRRFADREEDLADVVVVPPLLRVPDGQEPGLERDRRPFLVDTLQTGQVVERELDVVHLGAEVRLVGAPERVPATGLVVDHLAGACAGVVDAVDLAPDLGPFEVEPELLLDRERAPPVDRLRAGGEPDVVLQGPPHLLLLPFAVEDAFDPGEVALEMVAQHGLEPLALRLGRLAPPFLFAAVELLQDLVQEAAPRHLDSARLLGQARMVVVEVEAGAFQVVVERGGAEVSDVD